MTIVKSIIAALALGFAGLVVWAIAAGDFSAAMATLTADPWGWVTLADLYLGFVLISVVIFVTEESKPRALLWIVPIFFLGNVVSAAWLALRLGRLVRA